MLDIQFIRENKELVETKSQQKGYSVDLDQLLTIDSKIRETIPKLDDIQNQRNNLASQFSNSSPSESQLEHGRQLKDQSGE